MTDVLLIQRFTEGDERAFNELYKRYDIFLRKLFIKQTGDFEKLNDVIQDTWTKIYKAGNKYEHQKGFINWAIAIAMNIYRDTFRTPRKYNASKEVELLGDFSYLSDKLIIERDYKEEYLHIIKEAVNNRLEGRHREIMVLRTYGKMSFNEVTETMQFKDRQSAINLYHKAFVHLKNHITNENKKVKRSTAKTSTR